MRDSAACYRMEDTKQMPIELRRPARESFASDEEWIYECSKCAREYAQKMRAAEDKMLARVPTMPRVGVDKLTGAQRDARDMRSIHDYLAERPHLLARYKKHGLRALLE
jgi:hypothetical protein